MGTRLFCVRVVPNWMRSNISAWNSSTARFAAPIAGSAAVSESIGEIGMRCR